MTVEERGPGPGSDVLIRKVDSHLAALRAGLQGPELELAEELARCLRELVIATAHASAADRGVVRAAVHYFVLRRESRGKLLPVRSLAAAQRVVNKAVRQLGRPDLLVEAPGPLNRTAVTFPAPSADVQSAPIEWRHDRLLCPGGQQ